MKNTTQEQRTKLPPLDIIDLDEHPDTEDYGTPDNAPDTEDVPAKSGILSSLSRINIHIVLAVVVVIFILGIIYRFSNWGEYIDLNEIFSDGFGEYDNTFDSILPLIDAEGNPVYLEYGSDSTILTFGNAPFADDRDSENNLANLIQKATGATVYNCSVSGSYLSALWPYLSIEDCPEDIFNFYWLCTLAVGDSIDQTYLNALQKLGASAPAEAMDVYNTLNSVDLNTVDVIAIMYDASDYLAGHEMYSDQNSTDILQFTGNLEAGIELISDNYPNIRFIVMSPTYAYGLDEEGNYVSSDIQRYGQDVLSTYVIKQSDSCAMQSVTFIDNLYGTITEETAAKYLTDHIHLNEKGRQLVAERFLKALNHYNKK